MPRMNDRDLEQIWSWNARLPERVSTRVQDVIAETAQRWPFAPAICAWDGTFEYEQLIMFSSLIANHIVDCGIPPGTVLPLYMKKSKWVPVTMLGALQANCGIALIDASTPQERLCGMIQMLGSPFVLTTSDLHCSLGATITPILIDGLQFEEKRPSTSATTRKGYSSATAAVVFTSGSTGIPKGVMLSPECISSTAVHGCDLFQLDRASRVFQFASYSFDISLHETFMTLVAGGCLCIPSETERLNNAISAIEAFGANWICITPSAASSVLNGVTTTSLETIVFTGEAVTSRVCKFLDFFKVFSWYGASEVPLTSVSVLRKATWKPSQIGSRYPGICWIVKPDDPEVLCAISEVGELLVEGPMQTKGYLNDPEKTEAAFVTSPIWLTRGSSQAAGRSGKLYKTGDLVKYNVDGTLAYISRKDRMVKIRGQRVELGEVEHQIWNLMDSDAIGLDGNNTEVVVEAINAGGSEDVILTSFICIRSNVTDDCKRSPELTGEQRSAKAPGLNALTLSAPDQTFKNFRSALDSKLRQVLPDFMVPSVHLQLRSLPMTVSGKVDRRMLRSLAQRLSLEELTACRVSSPENYARPRNETEWDLCDLWARILGLDGSSISTTTSFLQCGGDSLKAITLAKALGADFDISTKVSQLLRKESTIQYMATLIGEFRCGKPRYEPRADIAAELKRRITALKKSCTIRRPRVPPLIFQKPQVLLTGATGYLGSQILGQLVSNHRIEKVILLVRADDVNHARQRIQEIARLSGWWTDSTSRRIETWVGNLAEPRLGLDEEKWNHVSLVDTIIHNGAVVSWGADFHALESVNVRSTVQILQAGLQSHRLRRFIYVSGGTKQEHDQRDMEYVDELNEAEGYSQTKYISEQLTLAAGRMYHERAGIDTPPEEQSSWVHQDRKFTVVKPGYIIGDHTTGISNIDDFLWKVVAGAVRMQSYPEDPPDSWLDLAEVTHVARYIVRQCHFTACDSPPAILSPPTSGDDSYHNNDGTRAKSRATSDASPVATLQSATNAESTDFLDDLGCGLPVPHFWAAVQAQTRVHLEPKDWSSWIDLAHRDMELEMETHPLWGIQQYLGPRLGSSCPRPLVKNGVDMPSRSVEVEAAVRRCVQYLIDVKFITIPDTMTTAIAMDGLSPSTRKRKRVADEDQPEECDHQARQKTTRDPQDRHQHHHQRIGRSKFTHY